MKKHRPTKNIRKMMKSIRPYVSFNYDLRTGMAGQSKAKIKRYYKELSSKTRPPHFIYRPRIKQHLDIAIKKAGIAPRYKQIKAVPIASTEDRPERRIHKGKFILQEKYVTTTFIPADPMAIIKDPKEYARKMIKENPDAEFYHIKVGGNTMPMVFTKRTFTAGFARILRKMKPDSMKKFVMNVLSGFDTSTTEKQSTYALWRAKQKRTPKKAGRKPKGYGSHR